jgi:hypothetical protein
MSFTTGGAADPNGNFNAIVAIDGWAASVRTGWRIDHCRFTGYHFGIYLMGTFSSAVTSSTINRNDFFGGGVQIFGPGDAAWTQPTALGTPNFLFIETNKFHSLGSLQTVLHFIATNNGARVVARHNEIYIDDTGPYKGSQGDFFDAHGSCHGSNIRGVRAYEIYNNRYYVTQNPVPYISEGVYLRGGTGVVHNNQFYSVNGRGGAIALYETRAAETGDTSGSASCPAACSTSARCTATYYRVAVAADPFTVFTTNNGNGTVVTGATSGGVATINSMANSGGNYLYFLSAPSVPLQTGEWLTVGGTNKVLTTSASQLVNGEGRPCCDQVGRGVNNSAEPAYFWNNYDELSNPAVVYTSMPAYFVENADYVKGVKPGYTAYQYPHPLARIGAPVRLRQR